MLTRQREEALAGFCLILFGKIIPEFLHETSIHSRLDFSLLIPEIIAYLDKQANRTQVLFLNS